MCNLDEWLCCRNDCHEEVAALMLYLVRAGHLDEAQQITTIMLINKLAPALKIPVLIFLQCVLPRVHTIRASHHKLRVHDVSSRACDSSPSKPCSML